jgi:hypothetical protein
MPVIRHFLAPDEGFATTFSPIVTYFSLCVNLTDRIDRIDLIESFIDPIDLIDLIGLIARLLIHNWQLV